SVPVGRARPAVVGALRDGGLLPHRGTPCRHPSLPHPCRPLRRGTAAGRGTGGAGSGGGAGVGGRAGRLLRPCPAGTAPHAGRRGGPPVPAPSAVALVAGRGATELPAGRRAGVLAAADLGSA